MKLAEAFIEARIDDSKVRSDMRSVETTVKASGDKMAKDLGDSGKRAAGAFAQVFGAAAFGAGIKASIDSASRLQQAVGATEVVFGSASKTIDGFAKHSAESLGLSEAAFRGLTSTMGALLTNLGFTDQAAADVSVRMTQLGSDLAATFDKTPKEATEALTAALRGEYDQLEGVGIKLSQAQINAKALELGLWSGKGAIDANAQAQAALALVTEQGAKYQGAFAKEADSAAGSATIAAAKAQDSAASLGKNFLPVYQKITELVGLLADGFGALPGPVQLGVVALVGFVALSGPIGTLVDLAKKLPGVFSSISTAIAGAQSSLLTFGVAGAALIAVGVTLGVIFGHLQDIAKVRAFNKGQVDEFRLSLQKVGEEAETVYEKFQKEILDKGKLEGVTFFSNQIKDLLPLLDKTGVSLQEYTAIVEQGEPALRRVADAHNTAGTASSDLTKVLEAALTAHENYQKALDLEALSQRVAGAATAAATQATTDAGDAAVSAASDMAQWSDAATTAKDDANKLQRAVDDMDATYQRLMGHLGDQSAWASVSSASAELQAKMLLGAAGTSEQERALLSAKQAAAEYVQGLEDVPPEVKSRLYAEIDQASVDNIYDVLANLSRTRFVNIVAIGGMAVDSAVRNAQEGRGVPTAEGGIFTHASRRIIGEAGAEVVMPLTNPSRLAALLGDRRVGPRVAAAMNGGASFAGASTTATSGASAGGDIITVIIEGEPITGRIVARERAVVAALGAGRRA